MIRTATQDVVQCPICKGRLNVGVGGHNCRRCQRRFPIVHDGLAVLFPCPERVLAKAYLRVRRTAEQLHTESCRLAELFEDSPRSDELMPISGGLCANGRFFAARAADLEEHVSRSELAGIDASTLPASYGYDFHYLDRDWTSPAARGLANPGTWREIDRCLASHEASGKACVLGMGSGRFAVEIAERFEVVCGVDSAYGQVAQFAALRKGDVRFSRIDTRNRVRSGSFVETVTASMPSRLADQVERVHCVWADAFDTPFAEDRFDWVFSVYFSDVRPLPELIQEVTRIVKPGGYFVHCGPLQYHFNDPEHHYSYEEFRSIFVANGFEVCREATSFRQPNVDVDRSLHVDRHFVDKILLLRYTG